MRQVLAELNGSADGVVWSELALRHGWYDQAHMNRDSGQLEALKETVESETESA